MVEKEPHQTGVGQGSAATGGSLPVGARLQADKNKLSEVVSDASDAVRKEAKALGSEAQQMAETQAEKVKEAATSHMDAFANALRAASDELGKNQSGPAAEMVSHAASGLETLSRSLHGKSTGEMLDVVRQFGRDNPIGFMAGSVLAGLALGRFATASSPSADTSAGDSRGGADGVQPNTAAASLPGGSSR